MRLPLRPALEVAFMVLIMETPWALVTAPLEHLCDPCRAELLRVCPKGRGANELLAVSGRGPVSLRVSSQVLPKQRRRRRRRQPQT